MYRPFVERFGADGATINSPGYVVRTANADHMAPIIREEIRRMVVAPGTKLAMVGVLLGLAGGAASTRLLQGMLYDTAQLDLTTFAAVAVLMGVTGALASYIPARRASMVDPLESMRSE